MTPKQKAEDLVNAYRIILMDADTYCGNEMLCTSIAIKNAWITVDEIWNALESARVFEEYDYWQQVKQELKNL